MQCAHTKMLGKRRLRPATFDLPQQQQHGSESTADIASSSSDDVGAADSAGEYCRRVTRAAFVVDDDDDDDEDDDIDDDGTEQRVRARHVRRPAGEGAVASLASAEHTGIGEQEAMEIVEERRDREQRDKVRACPLCMEEQPYLAESSGGSAGRNNRDRSAMLQKVQDFRKIIFRFERTLAGRLHDETVLQGMLQLRRTFIEAYLDEHGYRHTKWTIDMLRAHYDPVQGHRFDVVRELAYELEDLRRLRRWTMRHAMFVPNPDTGEPMFNTRAVDIRLRVSKQVTDTVAKLQTELRRNDADHAVDARMIQETVTDAVNRLTGTGTSDNAAAAAIETDPLASMYDVGGM